MSIKIKLNITTNINNITEKQINKRFRLNQKLRYGQNFVPFTFGTQSSPLHKTLIISNKKDIGKKIVFINYHLENRVQVTVIIEMIKATKIYN